MDNPVYAGSSRLVKYVTPLGVWALSFGCAVGWGAFVMPGTTFLPIAGPLGTVIGVAVGMLIMLIIGVNYHYLMNWNPDAGGTYSYTKNSFGYDHGFLSAWFLLLTYVAIIWANATALPLIARNLLGGLFQFGWHYELAGYQVYFGEVLLAVAALILAALLCLRGRLAVRVQIVMALILCAGVAAGLIMALRQPQSGPAVFEPPYSPTRKPLAGVLTIVALAPWAFAGFESVSHSAAEFTFPRKRSFRILAAAVVTAAAAYIILALLAIRVLPADCASWTDYIFRLGEYSGLAGLPTFHSAVALMGNAGRLVFGLTALGAIITGLVGHYVAASRLICALAEDDMLPKWFGRVDQHNVPGNAILFILAISVILPFFGRTAISWIIDVTTVGATIAYAYASAAALKTARIHGSRLTAVTGAAGLAISLLFMVFFLVPGLMGVTALSTESYFILAAWGILGFVFFLYLFRRDTTRRLGRSTFTWIVLLALIIYTSAVWTSQVADKATGDAMNATHDMYSEAFGEDGVIRGEEEAHRHEQLDEIRHSVTRALTRNSMIQSLLIVIALGLLFYIFSLMLRRERQIEAEKVLAEESSRAKTSFLSNMSHEIRTPMNAIIGLDKIALKDPNLPPHTREQLEKIGASAQHLLGLINDILDMSRIESGRMTLKDEEFNLRDLLDQVNVIINGQCMDKGLEYDCRIIGRPDDHFIGDDMKLRQVMINILGNAVKFTNAPGSVTLTVEQIAEFEEHRTLRFIMADTGIGMSKEYIPKIFEAFSQENSSVSNKYGSTGLGMAITKSIVEMFNGEIHVESEKGVGTTFTVTVTLKSAGQNAHNLLDADLPKDLRALVVDDDIVACEHGMMVLNAIGIQADYILSGQEAADLVRQQKEQGKPYDIVLTDYKMPGMDGIELTRTLRGLCGRELSVIILTGYSWDELQSEAMAAGADGVMSKPLFADSLLRQLQKILSHQTQNDGSQTEPGSGETSLAGLHVLIAEDVEINAEILISLLEMEGITAEHAENGKLAVELFASKPPETFDAVLMDVRMPVMDGLEATRAIRALDREDAKTIPIIAMTANAFDDDVQRSLQAGMTAHLSKPVEPERLFDTLARLVHPEEE